MNIWVRRLTKCIGFFLCLCMADFCVIYAAENRWDLERLTASEYEQVQEKILEDLELDDVENLLDEFTISEVSFLDMIKNLMNGGQALDIKQWKTIVSKMWQNVFGIRKKICIQIILLLLLTSFFSNLSGALKNPQIGEMAFYITYLLLFLLILQEVNQCCAQMQTAMESICEFMRALLPAYHLTIAASVGVSTAAMFYQMVIGIVYLAERIILHVMLPGIRFYLLIALVNHLTKDEWLSRLTDLIWRIISWCLHSMLGLLLGMQIVQRLISPAIDSLKKTILGKTASAIPVLGDIFEGATEIVLGAALLIKNCLGAAAIFCLLLISLVPMMQLGVQAVSYQMIAALMQPVSEKRVICCVHTMGATIFMLLRVLLTVEIMFLLTIAILASTFL